MFHDPAFHGGPEALSVHGLDEDVRPESASLDLTCGGGIELGFKPHFCFHTRAQEIPLPCILSLEKDKPLSFDQIRICLVD